MREGIPLVHRDAMRTAVSHIQDDSRGPSTGIQGKNGRRSEEQCRSTKCFKYQLSQMSSMSRGVVRRFRKQQRMLFHLGIEILFVVHGVFQEKLHGIPPAVGLDAASMQREETDEEDFPEERCSRPSRAPPGMIRVCLAVPTRVPITTCVI
eukprot:scaffold2482_cov50-Cyclotella_meneghiniana.AAC.3